MSQNEREAIEVPQKPLSPLQNAVLQGGLGAAFGAGISAAWQALSNWAHQRKPVFNNEPIIKWALDVGMLSAVIGWYTAKGDEKLYQSKLDNVALQQTNADLQDKVATLEAEKTPSNKSFVDGVNASKEARESHQAMR